MSKKREERPTCHECGGEMMPHSEANTEKAVELVKAAKSIWDTLKPMTAERAREVDGRLVRKQWICKRCGEVYLRE